MERAARHSVLGGKVRVYRRELTPHWHCSCTFGGRQHRVTTKEESLSRAKEVAADWYLSLAGKYRSGDLKEGKSFREVARRFMDEFEVIAQGQRSPVYIEGHKGRLKNHLVPFFGDKALSEITPGLVQDYRIHRMKTGRVRKVRDESEIQPRSMSKRVLRAQRAGDPPATAKPSPPSRSTLHQEIVCLRQVLKTAHRHRWLDFLPDLSTPYGMSGKISHRAWFSPDEYKSLYKATRERSRNPLKERWRAASETLHDYVLFMVNTGLRPDESLRLEFRDVAIVTDEATGERILEIEVRGKRGVGYCKSMPGAVTPFRRVKERVEGQPTDRLFPTLQRELFNAILEELDLKKDREGQARTFYSLRHTYICMRLIEGADIYQISKNCRTIVEMIEKYYASHIKNMLDASAINVMKSKPFRIAMPVKIVSEAAGTPRRGKSASTDAV